MILHNIRYTLRLLRESPGFAALAIGTLALGIGANTAIFSVVDAVMLRPLPYARQDRLVTLWERQGGQDNVPIPGVGEVHFTVAPANVVNYAAETKSFDGIASFTITSQSLTKSGTPLEMFGEAVTSNYFSVLGVQPHLGRAFVPAEDRADAPHVVILSDELWRDRFNGTPSIIGQTLTLGDEPYEVIGVMPPGFQSVAAFGFPDPLRFFVPAAYPDRLLSRRSNHIARVVARLKPGVAIEQGQADLDAVTARLARDFPRTNKDTRAMIGPLAPDLVRNVRRSLLILLGAVALVLVVACVNVANLLLVRAMGQRRDVAVRVALGATRRRIVMELLTRGLVIGVLGGALGLLCAAWTRDLLVAIAPAAIPRLDGIAMNGTVLAVTAAIAILSGVTSALLPALHASAWAGPELQQSGRTASAGPSVVRWRGVLMALETGAAVVLAIGAGLLVRSLVRLNGVDLGFTTEHVLVMHVNLPETRYADADSRLAFFESLKASAEALPGVETASYASEFPLGNGWGSDFQVIGSSAKPEFADFQVVGAEYFQTLGIPVKEGRGFIDRDGASAPFVAVVSDDFAKRFLPGRSPIGAELDWDLGSHRPPVTIVGVVGDVRRAGKAAAVKPQVFLAAAQTGLGAPSVARLGTFAIRAAGDARAFAGTIQKAVWAIDPDQAIAGVHTLDDLVWASMSERRFDLLLLASFAALAVGLALIGCYGVVSYAVAQRTREIAIRMAFGADTASVRRLILTSGLRWAGLGIAGGALAAAMAARLMRSMLFDVTPLDPWTFACVLALVGAVSWLASYLPARRASAVAPGAALQSD